MNEQDFNAEITEMFNFLGMYGSAAGTSLASTLLSSREFSAITVDPEQVSTRAEMMAKLASIPDDELDTMFIAVLRRGKARNCGACDKTHYSVENISMALGDHLSLIAMLNIILSTLRGTEHQNVGTVDEPQEVRIAAILRSEDIAAGGSTQH